MNLLYVLAFVGLMAGIVYKTATIVAANGDIFSLPAIPIVPRRAPLATHCVITHVRRDNCPSEFDFREELEDFVVGTGEKKN
ncbi:hypothetical protein PRIPAC_97736 [Pristionchus pacificus]|uniref:Uncharacterized protein n=1 Tax=Pristionchus pacificus TaxID=54126 RepID=A0A2A6BCS5_PRIPA|nr:hypothetical protein PRIPAC_97736 [Pristionchus pacificus]|eukprot:PDM63692.1 hypothetical protein PRIPAC_49665 [Pristionchus pacificus]